MSKPPVSKSASGAAPPNHQAMDASTFDVRAFRQALGAFVTGVTIVTTLDADGQPAGLTANSFNSVSLDPPMVLWSLALESANLDAFRQASHWAVHVLASGQEHLSIQFASRTHNRFAGVTTTPGSAGIPLMDGYAARFICSAAFEHDGGDHAIFLGRVEAFERTTRTPLVYHQGRYAGVFPAAPAEAPAASITALEKSRPGGTHERPPAPFRRGPRRCRRFCSPGRNRFRRADHTRDRCPAPSPSSPGMTGTQLYNVTAGDAKLVGHLD